MNNDPFPIWIVLLDNTDTVLPEAWRFASQVEADRFMATRESRARNPRCQKWLIPICGDFDMAG